MGSTVEVNPLGAVSGSVHHVQDEAHGNDTDDMEEWNSLSIRTNIGDSAVGSQT